MISVKINKAFSYSFLISVAVFGTSAYLYVSNFLEGRGLVGQNMLLLMVLSPILISIMILVTGHMIFFKDKYSATELRLLHIVHAITFIALFFPLFLFITLIIGMWGLT